jgi:2-(1,2-epoxy-1,2-dihydrophenyl)acetyl-CoA isomerase
VTQPPEPTRVHLEIAGALATITLDGPSSRNALSSSTAIELLDAVRQAGSDERIRAVLVTGAHAAFTAGADVREMRGAYESGSPPDLRVMLQQGLNPLISAVTSMSKPVLAAIPGPAAGAGLALALACDLRLAARSAVFSTAFTGIGLTADAGMSWTLPRIVGSARAMALLMLPERIPAERALELGLVQAVLPDDLLAASASELATRLSEGPTAAYAALKRSLAFSATASLEESMEFEADQQQATGRTRDHQNAVLAFLNRQPPTFTGR